MSKPAKTKKSGRNPSRNSQPTSAPRSDYLLAIDQGTTSTRAIIFDAKLNLVHMAQQEITQYFPKSGWVEHDPEEIWASVLATVRSVLRKSKLKASQIKAIGITNQRETTLIWDRKTGKPIYKAIVWQDRRTADFCKTLKDKGYEAIVHAKTGLLLDPYFSGTKISWLLDHVKGARAKAEKGSLCFGTVDSFLIWRLTGGKAHVTDATNASRTLAYNIHSGQWDDELTQILNIPASLLPEIKDCAADFGNCMPELFGAEIPISGVAGDQQAAAIGQACFAPGMMKATYGTGCFALLNTGGEAVMSDNRLLTTVAYQFNGTRTYALEGAIFIAGAAVQWLRDGLKLIKQASDAARLAALANPQERLYLVPAFVGLGAPYWNSEVRGALFGITRATTANDLARATLEAVCYQTDDLLRAMERDWGNTRGKTILRVDGGMAASDWTMQFLSDILNLSVERPKILETTAVGAAYLAGYQANLLPAPGDFSKLWHCQKRFTTAMKQPERAERLAGWATSIRKVLA